MGLVQGSSDWLEWRRAGIGASDVGVIFGVDPHKTARQLWEEKRTLLADLKDTRSTATQRGHEHESMIRAALGFELDCEFTTDCFEHPEFPWLRASLDGWCDEKKLGLEIKSVGKDAINLPQPMHHFLQVQTQMLVTATFAWEYVRTTDGVNYKRETIHAEPTVMAEILERCFVFYQGLSTGTPPEYESRDWVPCEDTELVLTVQAWQGAKGVKKASHREDLLRLSASRKRTICQGVKISTDPPRVTG